MTTLNAGEVQKCEELLRLISVFALLTGFYTCYSPWFICDKCQSVIVGGGGTVGVTARGQRSLNFTTATAACV